MLKRALMRRTVLEHAFGVAVRRVHHEHVHARGDQGGGASPCVGAHAHGGAHAQAAPRVIGGVGDTGASSGCP